MDDINGILRSSIEQTCGPKGVTKFDAACAGRSFARADGTPDVEGINQALSGLFPPHTASAIAVDLMKRLKPALAGPRGESRNPRTMARYLNADPNHVRDIVTEARRVRVAMGKMGSGATPDQEEKAPELEVLEGPWGPGSTLTAEDPVDKEIQAFVYSRSVPSSMDIIDFTRYLKDKGYSFHENIVLEKIYVKIQERKKEARSILEQEVERFIDETPEPSELAIVGFLRDLRGTGLPYEEDEVRRMIRTALLRRG